MDRLEALASIIQERQQDIISDWREQVRQIPQARHLDKPTLDDSVGVFLDEISNALIAYVDRRDTSVKFQTGPPHHGIQRFELGFNITQVIIEYNLLRQVLLDYAENEGLNLDGTVRRALHRLIDEAIAQAVQTFATAQTASTESRVQQRLSYVLHDVKTPLSAIHMAAILLEKRLSEESRKRVSAMLSIILRNCEHLNTMLMKLLEEKSSALAVLHSELVQGEVQLHRIVEELIADLRPLADRSGVNVINEVASDLIFNADAYLCKQALQNLLSNALKYTTHGTITIGAKTGNRLISFWVADTGVGMSKEKAATLFSSEVVADPMQPSSSGMGLAIVKKIAEAHSGTVGVESEPGKGTIVTIELPQ